MRHQPPKSGNYYVAKLGTFAVAVYRRRGEDADAWVAYTEEQSQGRSHDPARWVQRQVDETKGAVALRAQRLWGAVEIAGQRIDVRSGSCADPGMQPLIEAKKSMLRGAGLTKLRCVEQSGAVVFERDL